MSISIRKQLLPCFFAACAMLAGTAQAIVSTTDSALASGSGQSFLDGVARLTITRSDGKFGCSGSLLSGGAYVLTAAHCVSGNTGNASSSAITVSFMGGQRQCHWHILCRQSGMEWFFTRR